jgi:hypothetical protein
MLVLGSLRVGSNDARNRPKHESHVIQSKRSL